MNEELLQRIFDPDVDEDVGPPNKPRSLPADATAVRRPTERAQSTGDSVRRFLYGFLPRPLSQRANESLTRTRAEERAQAEAAQRPTIGADPANAVGRLVRKALNSRLAESINSNPVLDFIGATPAALERDGLLSVIEGPARSVANLADAAAFFKPARRAEQVRPERIRAAAFKRGDEVIEGVTHGAILEQNPGFVPLMDSERYAGFVTDRGRFLTRDEAARLLGRNTVLAEDIADGAAVLPAGGAGGDNVGVRLRRGGFTPEQRVEQTGDSRFYSRLQKAILDVPQEKATGAQWAGMLNKGGTWKAEREWTQIDNFLKENADKTLTRQEVLDYARQNAIRLRETVLGKVGIEGAKKAFERADQIHHEAALDLLDELERRRIPQVARANIMADIKTDMLADDIVAKRGLPEDIRDVLERAITTQRARRDAARVYEAAAENAAKYEQYTLPGGTNYREVLIQLDNPETKLDPSRVKITRNRRSATQGDYTVEYDGKTFTFEDKIDLRNGKWEGLTDDEILEEFERYWRFGGGFRTDHFPGHNNIVVHARLKDRVLPNGERVLLVEEVQSDWAAKGRKKGFRPSQRAVEQAYQARDAAQAELDRLNGKLATAREEWLREVRRLHEAARHNPDGSLATQREYEENLAALLESDPVHLAAAEKLRKLQEQWRDAQLRMEEASQLVSAKDAGVPDTPFKRADDWMGLAMKRIIDEAARNGYDRVAWTTGAQQIARYDLSKHVDDIIYRPPDEPTGLGTLQAFDHEGTKVLEVDVRPSELPDYIGQELADKLLKTEKTFGGKWHSLSGVDLQMGGEKHQALYDKMLPRWVRDYGKKLGVQIDVEPLDFDPTVDVTAPGADRVTPFNAAIVGNPSFRITPELRQLIEQFGQPLGAAAGLYAAGQAMQAAQAQQQQPVQPLQLGVTPFMPVPQLRPQDRERRYGILSAI